jgi:hypothetical protein
MQVRFFFACRRNLGKLPDLQKKKKINEPLRKRYDLSLILLMRKKMSTKIKSKQKRCPFTLELCQDCREQIILDHQRICSFTLELCSFYVTGGLTRSKEKGQSHPSSIYITPHRKKLLVFLIINRHSY